MKIPISERPQNTDCSAWQGSARAVIDGSDEGTSITGKAFAAQGDSGLLVLDANRRVIGLLLATRDSITYFIPFDAVMEDIEYVTGERILTPVKDMGVPGSTGA